MNEKWVRLSEEKKKEFEAAHRSERDGRVRDRIKAVLLRDEDWSCKQIAQALRINEETVRRHLDDWISEQKLKPENGGSLSKLNAEQSVLLDAYISKVTYTKVSDICKHVKMTFNISYTVSGMTKWLKQHDFRFKKPKAVPAKTDLEKQAAFIKEYEALKKNTPDNEPILFIDSAHPTMATKAAYGWIKKGVNKPIAQTASRTRINVMGAIELKTMKTINCFPEKVDGESIGKFFDLLKTFYPNAPKIHLILDQSGYHRSQFVKDKAKEKGIELHYLSPYSPNLNPIERMWKIMNETARNNVFFESTKHFREAIYGFFNTTVHKMESILRSRITDNFQKIIPASSS